MNPGIHGSDFCLTGIAEVKEYPCIKQTGMLVAKSNSQWTIWRQEFGINIIHKPAGDEMKKCGGI